MDGCDIIGLRSLEHLAQEAYNVLVNEVAVQVLRSNRRDACLTDEGTKALQGCKLNGGQISQSEELEKNGYDSSLEKRVDSSCPREEDLTELSNSMQQLFH